jgi:hypothetical protein
MGWLASIFVGVLSGALGLIAAGLVAAACVDWYRVSGFEGKSGYFVVLNALFGGFIGLVVGIVASRLVAASSHPGFWKALGASCATVLVVAGVVALLAWLFADIPPEIDGNELTLEVEFRLPIDQVPPKPPEAASPENRDERPRHSFTLGSVINHVQRASRTGEVDLAHARFEDGHWIVPASVPLFTTRGLRSIDLELDGRHIDGFLVPLPGRPGREHLAWSEWGPRPPPPAEPWPDSKPSFRFRVAKVVPPPPGPTYEEIQAQEHAREQAAFESIPADAPIEEWFPHTRYGASDERRGIAIAHIIAKPGWIDELGVLMDDEDSERAGNALYLVEHVPPSPELAAKVAEAGRQIAARMRKVNASTPEQDPGYHGFADVSVRFSAWMAATRALRAQATGDFVAELREMLVLSRMRSDSYVMRNDVRRVASYYAQQWAGLPPDPDDPPPR